MLPPLPATIDELRGGTDAAPLVDAAIGWSRYLAAGEAQRLALLAEWAALWLADADDDTCLGAVDDEDDVVAHIGMAFGISPRWAYRDLQIGAAMRERFPQLAALFHRGEISARVMSTVVERTLLVVDDEALASIDTACVEAATVCGWSGLSYQKLKNAIDLWVERFDPDAVRRVRNTVRGRGVTVQHGNDDSALTTIVLRLTKPGAALLLGRVRTMAKEVCAHDPRTLDQRMADAAEALGADADHLTCLCGSDTCPAAADDGVASRFVVHIYGEADLPETQPDPLIHGDGVIPTGPDNVTVKPSKPRRSGPRQSPTPAAEVPTGPVAAKPAVAGKNPEYGESSGARETAAPSAAEATNEAPRRPKCSAAGVIPQYGVVPNALIAALVANGAEVRPINPPSIEPTESYRLRGSDRDFVQARDLTCRAPGCDRPIHEADLDHTIPWGQGGPTHPSSQKGYCRWHHVIKTFRGGWSEVQNPDGTIRITTPTGHTYTSIPTSRLYFPTANTSSAPVQRGSPRKEPAADKSVKMPKRRRTKAKDRAYRIAAERALNAAHRAHSTVPAHHRPKKLWDNATDTTDAPPPF